jgi:hypothetical protein
MNKNTKNSISRIKAGEIVSWQRQLCNLYSGVVLCFCPKGSTIASVLDLSKYQPHELKRIDLERGAINRYLIYVQNVGIVSVAALTIEKQNPNANRFP